MELAKHRRSVGCCPCFGMLGLLGGRTTRRPWESQWVPAVRTAPQICPPMDFATSPAAEKLGPAEPHWLIFSAAPQKQLLYKMHEFRDEPPKKEPRRTTKEHLACCIWTQFRIPQVIHVLAMGSLALRSLTWCTAGLFNGNYPSLAMKCFLRPQHLSIQYGGFRENPIKVI